jgi:hypothetical protein
VVLEAIDDKPLVLLDVWNLVKPVKIRVVDRRIAHELHQLLVNICDFWEVPRAIPKTPPAPADMDTMFLLIEILCPTLQQILRESWLESENGVPVMERPTRIYRLIDSGVRHLKKEVVSFEKMFAGITRGLAVA